MGNPTFGGLELLQLRMEETGFPISIFRRNACSTLMVFEGYPWKPRAYFEGEVADLLMLARRFPYEEPENVSLSSPDGRYGISIEKTVFRVNALLQSEQGFASAWGVYSEMHAFGDPRFREYFDAHREDLQRIARYGKPHPRIRERFAMRFLSYHFPPPVMEEASALA